MHRWLPVCLLACACAGEGRKPAEGQVLRVGTNSEITAPSPFGIHGLGATVEELVFRSPLRSDAGGRLQGDLVAGWSFADGGKRLTLRLHPGLRFSDGAPLTSRDVVDTFERARKQRSQQWGVDQVVAIHAGDDATVEVETARPGVLPLWLIIGVAEAGAKDLVGAGPYTVAERDASRLVLRANPIYQPAPGVKTIEFLRFANASDGWSRLLGRDVDLITFVPWAKEEFLKEIPSVREVKTLSQSLIYLHFVRPEPPFDVAANRHALSLGIDRRALVESAIRGHAQPARGVVWPESEEFDRTLAPEGYEPKRARQILVDHGATVGPDGMLQWQGRPLRLLVRYLLGFTEIEDTARQLEQQLLEFGIHVELEGKSIEDAWALEQKGPAPAVVLRYRHHAADLVLDDEARQWNGGAPLPASLTATELQRRLRDEPPSIYLFWPERLDVIDKRFCGLPRLPGGPEPALQLVHPCGAGETE